MPFSAGKYMDKICHTPYKKGIRSTWMTADAFILRIFSECAQREPLWSGIPSALGAMLFLEVKARMTMEATKGIIL